MTFAFSILRKHLYRKILTNFRHMKNKNITRIVCRIPRTQLINKEDTLPPLFIKKETHFEKRKFCPFNDTSEANTAYLIDKHILFYLLITKNLNKYRS